MKTALPLPLILLMVCASVRFAGGCLFLLNGGSQQRRRLSAGERAERAEIVLVASVLGQRPALQPGVARDRYSALCHVSEILKGARLVQTFSAQRLLWVSGFGSPVKCLAEARPGHDYIMFLRPVRGSNNESFTARYDDVSGAVAEYNSHNAKAVETALGWNPWESWSPCNKTCDVGERLRARTCLAQPCDYGDRIQKERCALWLCNRTTVLSIRGSVAPARSPEARRKRLGSTSGVLTSILPNSRAEQVTLSMELRMVELGKRLQLLLLEANHIKLLISIDTTLEHVEAQLNGRQISSSPIDVTIGRLHHLLLNLKNSTAILYWDCQELLRVSFIVESLLTGAHLKVGPGFSGVVSNILQVANTDVASTCVRQPIPKTLEVVFSAWSPCSATCGEAVQERYARCRRGGSDCLTGTEYEANSGIQTRACTNLPSCITEWKQGLECSNSRACLNGGLCVRGHCICRVGFEGIHCERALCQPTCRNGGRCLSRNRCSCLPGWKGRSCQRRITARRPGDGRPRGGCPQPCKNKGQCVKGVCVCPLGYRGKRCHRAICLPKCKNGGRCIYPNLCKCPTGYSGQSCKKVECFPSCMNGGKCTQPGKCKCAAHFSGKFCQRVKCRKLCLNGGRCSSQGICRCVPGFFGTLCQKRRCIRQLKYRTVYKPTLRSFKEDDYYLCYKHRRVKLCRRKKWKSVVVYKIVLKPQFRCADK